MYLISISDKNNDNLYRYSICSKTLTTDIPIDILSPFLKEEAKRKYSYKNPIAGNQSDYDLIYKGTGSIGDSLREILFYKNKNHFKLIIPDIGNFLINYSSKDIEIFLLDSKLPTNDKFIIEALLGPVLIFCLALDGIFCFHASAIEHENKAIIFLGKSGSGKSTLADYLDKSSDGKFKRIADDIIPVTYDGNSVSVLPHFPQLKLSNERQYSLNNPERVPVSAIYLLEKKQSDIENLKVEKLVLKDSVLSLVANTVASRLFDNNLNSKHLDLCSDLSSKISFNKLIYPHNKQNLSLINELIAYNS